MEYRSAITWTTALCLVLFLFTSVQAQESNPVPDPVTTPTTFDNPDLVKRFQETITADDLAAHLYLFASDLFEGRETTARGQKLAANYLANQYRRMGLQPKGTMDVDDPRDPRAYFQSFTLEESKVKQARLELMVDGESVATSEFSATRQTGNGYFMFGRSGDVTGDVAFIGYGIADDELGYNDYTALKEEGIDVTGKWLIMLRDEPLASKDKSLFPTENGEPSRWTRQFFSKIGAAFQNNGMGAAGFLIVGDAGPNAPEDFADTIVRMGQALKYDVGSLSLPGGSSRGGFSARVPPIFQISSELADKLLAPTGKTVAQLQNEINSQMKPVVFDVEGASVHGLAENATTETSSENVLAFIEGKDPELKEEVIVISSHYDHVGIDWQSDAEDRIFNGADDDGSGTVTVLEIAEAFAKAAEAGYRPRRSVLFLNVSGEEKGLLGSQYYTDTEPVIPLEKTVTNLNLDMVGRYDPTHPDDNQHYIYIIGSNLISQELHDINAKANTVTDIQLDLHERFNSKDDPNQFYRRSDHWNFGKHGIPFIFFFNGTHDDYHGLDDEPDRIAYERMADVARLVFATAWQVANQDKPPAVSGTGFNE